MPSYSYYNRQGLSYIISLNTVYYSKCVYSKIKYNVSGLTPNN